MKGSFFSQIWLRILLWLSLVTTLIIHLWAANRGLEMTDEASYLLIALDPWKTWGHGTFHGFLLRPLYLLGGESVVGLRWIGYVVLLAAAWRLASAIRLRLGSNSGVVSVVAHPVLMVASLTFYSAGIRTPCYNWMILVGALLLWSGWLRCGRGCLGPVEMGLGLAIVVVGKWTAAPFLLALMAATALHQKYSWAPNRAEGAKALLVFLVVTGSFVLYAGIGAIRDTLQAGLLSAQSTSSHGWFLIPKYGWEIFYYLYRMGRAFIWLLPLILIFWCVARRNPKKWKVEKIATILFGAGLSLAALRGWWRGGIDQFGKESLLAGCWLLGVAWAVWVVRRGSGDREERAEDEGGCEWSVVGVPSSVLWALVLTPFFCGIGTNTSIADYAGQGTVFFAAAGILLLGSADLAALSQVATVALAGLCLVQASRVSTSLLGMYRVGSVLKQTDWLEQGPEKGKLRVDSQTGREIREIYLLASAHGFQARDPVIGLDSLCGWIYLTGGTSPGSPWFQRDQVEYVKQILARCDIQGLRSSWIWIRSSSQMRDPACWWPIQIYTPQWLAVGQVSLSTDRGAEKLFLMVQKKSD